MARYVILHHRIDATDSMLGRATHFDWMFDHGQMLWTWATETLPSTSLTGPLVATRIADHRREYLDFEGAISGNRGSVSRVESGNFELVTAIDDLFEFRVSGPRYGVISFQRVSTGSVAERSGDCWTWTFLPIFIETNGYTDVFGQ